MTIELKDMAAATHHARRAIRRGDLAAAERWFKLADRAGVVAKRFDQLESEKKRRANLAAALARRARPPLAGEHERPLEAP